MALLKPWVKAELEFILQVGLGGCLPPRRTRRQAKKQHVQCVEVDVKHSGLKISDSNALVWCFVSKEGMKTFNDGTNPSFASLENKIITIEDWEFSTLSILCPTFEKRRAKNNCQICLLITKFVLLSGERTTTIGNPTNLVEGNRDVRTMLRSLTNPKDFVRALAYGQGLEDLRDIDEVLMSAPDPQTAGLSWSDIDPELTEAPTKPATGQQDRQTPINPGTANQRKCAREASKDGPPSASDASKSRCSTTGSHNEEPSVQMMSQNSQNTLGMEYDGEFEDDGEEDYRTQAPSAGNVFSQEPMEIRPASPTPSPLLPRSGSNPDGPRKAEARDSDRAELPPVATSSARDTDAYEDAPLGDDRQGEGSVESAARPPVCGDPDELSDWHRIKGGRYSGEDDGEIAEGNAEDGEEEEEGPVPDGFTQLEVLPENPGAGQAQPERSDGGLEFEDDDELLAQGALSAAAGKGKGKAKARTNTTTGGGRGGDAAGILVQQRPALDSNAGALEDGQPRANGGKGKRKAVVVDGPGSAPLAVPSRQSSPLESTCSSQELSGGTFSSSTAPAPSKLRQECRYLTGKRNNGDRLSYSSRQGVASRTVDIRSRFGGSGAAASGSRPGGEARRRRISDSSRDKPSLSSSTVEPEVGGPSMEKDVLEKAAKMFPTRPLRYGSLHGWKRDRPLSDLIVAVDLKWNGEGRPPIVARGYDVDPLLAEWLDAPPREQQSPYPSVAEWVEIFKERRSRRKASGRRQFRNGKGSSDGSLRSSNKQI